MTPTLNTAGLSAQEIADRRAIQAVWVKYWDIYVTINDIAPAKRAGLLAPVSVDPIKGQVLQSALDFDKQGLGAYGNVTHRIYWGPSVDGHSPAIMGDCLDTSKYGSLTVATKQKRSVGVPRANVHGVFVRGADGLWRLEELQLLENQPC